MNDQILNKLKEISQNWKQRNDILITNAVNDRRNGLNFTAQAGEMSAQAFAICRAEIDDLIKSYET